MMTRGPSLRDRGGCRRAAGGVDAAPWHEYETTPEMWYQDAALVHVSMRSLANLVQKATSTKIRGKEVHDFDALASLARAGEDEGDDRGILQSFMAAIGGKGAEECRATWYTVCVVDDENARREHVLRLNGFAPLDRNGSSRLTRQPPLNFTLRHLLLPDDERGFPTVPFCDAAQEMRLTKMQAARVGIEPDQLWRLLHRVAAKAIEGGGVGRGGAGSDGQGRAAAEMRARRIAVSDSSEDEGDKHVGAWRQEHDGRPRRVCRRLDNDSTSDGEDDETME